MYISTGKKNKFKTIDLSVAPKELCSTIIDHFRNDLNLCSSHETKRVLETYNRLWKQYIEQRNKPWKGWSKQMRCDGVIDYVFRTAREQCLSDTQRMNLFVTINVGLTFNYIRSTDVHCKNGKIVQIDGLHEENGRYRYDRHAIKEQAEPTKKQVTLAVLWTIYIGVVLKKYKELQRA
jgi:hypothetical protein